MESAQETLLRTLENNEMYKKICADIENAVLNGVNEINVGYLIKKYQDYLDNRFIFHFLKTKQYTVDLNIDFTDVRNSSITISW